MHFYKSFVRSIYSSYFFLILLVTHNKKCLNPNPQIDKENKKQSKKKRKKTQVHIVQREREALRDFSICTHPSTHTWTHTQAHTGLEMAQTSWGTQLATITLPEMNHLLLISAHSPPLAYSSQLDFRTFLFSNHFHKSLLIDPRIVPDSGVLLLFGFQAVAGFVPWLFTGWTSLWRWLIST